MKDRFELQRYQDFAQPIWIDVAVPEGQAPGRYRAAVTVSAEALCLGPQCGRCLKACPGDVIGQWERDWQACDRYRSPHGFARTVTPLSYACLPRSTA